MSGDGTRIVVGRTHTCALWGGAVSCWGQNAVGQLGNGSAVDQSTAQSARGLSGVASLAAAGDHACAIDGSGAVWCWGANSSGQLGDASTTPRSVPVNVSGLTSGWVAVVAGMYHSCAVTAEYGVRYWGNNMSGQLVMGHPNFRPCQRVSSN